jgi:TonB family protein
MGQQHSDSKCNSAQERDSSGQLEILAFAILTFLMSGCATETAPYSTDAADGNRYSRVMHSRFYEAWTPPRTIAAPAGRFTALVDVQIDRHGRVVSFNIVRASGIEEIDQSIAAVGRKVTRLAPPPLTSAELPFDLKIYFDLDLKS